MRRTGDRLGTPSLGGVISLTHLTNSSSFSFPIAPMMSDENSPSRKSWWVPADGIQAGRPAEGPNSTKTQKNIKI